EMLEGILGKKASSEDQKLTRPLRGTLTSKSDQAVQSSAFVPWVSGKTKQTVTKYQERSSAKSQPFCPQKQEKDAYWQAKAKIAKIKALVIQPCDDVQYQTHHVMMMIQEEIWPTISQMMKACIDDPSEVKINAISELSATVASLSASAFALSFYPNNYSVTFTGASTAAFVSPLSASAYLSVPYAFHASYVFTSGFASHIASASTFFFTTSASISSTASFTETLEIANLANDITNKVARSFSRIALDSHMFNQFFWLMDVGDEITNYARAVARYKAGQEIVNAGSISESPQWKKSAESAWLQARKENNENVWRVAGEAAREAMLMCQQTQGMTAEESLYQQNYWKEKADLADIKVLVVSPCADDLKSKYDRANAIMEVVCEKFRSPISQAMREFMKHPNEATLRAIGKSSIIAMSAVQAEESLETTKIFAEIAAKEAMKAREKEWSPTNQENLDWLVTITSEIAEFTQALAIFKKEQKDLRVGFDY
ncbi:MAG TPA: hypothetical protein VJK54_02540, partial [Chthoniobacterales bacterium]|nr:hypothetical protein [Chthoniobacterales bacterium]